MRPGGRARSGAGTRGLRSRGRACACASSCGGGVVSSARPRGRSSDPLRRPVGRPSSSLQGSLSSRGRGRRRSPGLRPSTQDGPYSGTLPAPRRDRPETSSGLNSIPAVGTILALANQKGGVGKTTTAVNLAACLAEAGARTLVVDLDPQANATSGLGERANGTSSYDLLDGAPLEEIVHRTRFENLDVVPSRP